MAAHPTAGGSASILQMAGLELEVVIVCAFVAGGLVEVDGEGEGDKFWASSEGCWA